MGSQNSIKPIHRGYLVILLVGFFSGLIWLLILFYGSPGSPVDDEIEHFNIARFACHSPLLILDYWGRVLNTLCYMPLSFLGLAGGRVTSMIFAVGTVLYATAIAKKADFRFFFLVPFFLWFQPWFCDLSYCVLTEVPFSFFFILGFYFLLTERLIIASLCLGLLPLIRHEAILLLFVWIIYLFIKRQRRLALLSLAPTVIYYLIYYFVFSKILLFNLLQPHNGNFWGSGFDYGKGGWTHYLQPLLGSVGLPVFVLSLFSIGRINKYRESLIIGILLYIVYLAIHVIGYRFSLYGSGGYVLFLLPLAPVFAITAASGLEFIETHFLNVFNEIPNKLLRLLIIVFSIVHVMIWELQTAKFRPLNNEERCVKQAADFLHYKGIPANRISAQHTRFIYFYNLPFRSNKKTLDHYVSGDVVIWDRHYSDTWGEPYKYFMNPVNGWQELKRFSNIVVIFQKK